jgi:hypothetical protein
MKYVKLILIIAVVAGLIYGAFRMIGPSSGSIKIDPTSPTLLKDLKKKVDMDWNNASEWNQGVYERNIRDADTYHKDLDNISLGNYDALIGYTNEKVCGKLIEFLNAEFALPNCSEEKILRMEGHIDYFVKKAPNMNNDSRIIAAKEKIKLYKNILAFGNKSFGLDPKFDMYSGTWKNDFESYRNSQIDIRNGYRNNGYYKSISHITEVEEALSSAESRLNDARNSFAKKLSNQIIAAYKDVERTERNKEKLREIYNRYYDDRNGFKDGNKLYDFKKSFDREVKEYYNYR